VCVHHQNQLLKWQRLNYLKSNVFRHLIFRWLFALFTARATKYPFFKCWREKKMILCSCGAVKRRAHHVHQSEPPETNAFQSNKRPYQHSTESAERGLSEISFAASQGERAATDHLICGSLQHFFFPPSKRQKTEEAERKENTAPVSLNQWETRKQSMLNTPRPFSYSLTRKLKERDLVFSKRHVDSVWVAAAKVCACELVHACKRAPRRIILDYFLHLPRV